MSSSPAPEHESSERTIHDRRSRSRFPVSKPSPSAPLDPAVFQLQEVSLISLNLLVLAGLFLIHVGLFTRSGTLPIAMLLALALRFVMQSGEALFLSLRREPISARAADIYAHASIWMHILFVFLLTFVGDPEREHFIVLMVLPVVASAFRFHAKGIIAVVAVASLHSFFEAYYSHLTHVNRGMNLDYYSASTISLIYVLVGAVVWMLVGQLRDKEARLANSLEKLEQAQSELVSREKMAAIGRLASSLAHEIRNPVAAISSSLQIAMSNENDRELRREMCEILTTETRRLELLTGEFLDYARPKTPTPQVVSLHDTIDYVSELARVRAESARVTIANRCNCSLKGYFDPFQIHQVLLNLLHNAVEASPAGSEVIIDCVEFDDDTIAFVVCNPPPPISEEVLRHLFEPFTTTKVHGTGLGLSVSRNLTERNGGALRLVRNDSTGVQFEVGLPRAKDMR